MSDQVPTQPESTEAEASSENRAAQQSEPQRAAPAASQNRASQQNAGRNDNRRRAADDDYDDDYDEYDDDEYSDYDDEYDEYDEDSDEIREIVTSGPADYTPSTQRGRSRRINNDVKLEDIDYKKVTVLNRFLDPRGRILSRRKTGVSAKVQRRAVVAIKRARHLALLPFTAEQTRVTRLHRRGGGR